MKEIVQLFIKDFGVFFFRKESDVVNEAFFFHRHMYLVLYDSINLFSVEAGSLS